MAWPLSGAHGHSPQPAPNKKEGFVLARSLFPSHHCINRLMDSWEIHSASLESI